MDITFTDGPDDMVTWIASDPGFMQRASHALVAGEHTWLTRPTVDSYHTVWFELHEDLLATLGRTRSDERGDGAVRRAGDNAEEFA